MKIAVSGKGGVGKTTFTALLARALNLNNKQILVIDADPDANLASAIGIKNADKIIPISEMKELILERTEAKPGSIGGFFKLNPRVDDLPDQLSAIYENIKLMRLGGVKKGGAGCICPETTLLKALVMHVVIFRDEYVILDMEAGIEHLGRGTAKSVDKLFIVVEPGRRSIETALNIKKLGADIGLNKISIIGNKIRNKKDEDFLKSNLQEFDFTTFLPYEDAFIEADLNAVSPFDMDTKAKKEIFKIINNL